MSQEHHVRLLLHSRTLYRSRDRLQTLYGESPLHVHLIESTPFTVTLLSIRGKILMLVHRKLKLATALNTLPVGYAIMLLLLSYIT
jgi:hypothetical protein